MYNNYSLYKTKMEYIITLILVITFIVLLKLCIDIQYNTYFYALYASIHLKSIDYRNVIVKNKYNILFKMIYQ